MDLQRIKDIVQKLIKLPSGRMARARSIEELSRELKSISPRHKHEVGIYKEAIVALDLCGQGQRLLAHRLGTPFAEVDLLFQKFGAEPGKVLVEVKSLPENAWSLEILSLRQKQRLSRACHYLQERYGEPVEGRLALVDSRYEAAYIEDFWG